MKFIVYLTINLKSSVDGNNRIYVGVHKTNDPEIFDGYLGCGVHVNQPSTYMYPKTPFQCAVKKYGTDAFKRITLYEFDSEEEAYKKEAEIVDLNFLKLNYTYNASLGGKHGYNFKPLYQFNLKGELIKKWEYSKDAYEFYNLPIQKFEYAVHDKHLLLGCFWSNKDKIDNIDDYSTVVWGEPKVTHLYNKDGKWLNEFISRKECADFIGTDEKNVGKAIKQQSLICKQYYVSDKMVDLFIPKARPQYAHGMIYIYDKNCNLIGQGIGKAIMPIINQHSWQIIDDAFRYKNGWYKDYYLSLTPVTELPSKYMGQVDVYDKYGNFIETLDTIKQVKDKYNVPSSKIKHLEKGNKYYGDYIFKYHSKK